MPPFYRMPAPLARRLGRVFSEGLKARKKHAAACSTSPLWRTLTPAPLKFYSGLHERRISP